MAADRPGTDSAPSAAPAAAADARVLVGEVAGAHGIRGAVKVRSFTADPAAIADYGPLRDDAGRAWRLRVTGAAKSLLICDVEGVRDRTAAEAMAGTRLWVGRDRLPPAGEDEFYHADLLGLPVETADGAPFGSVVALYDFGAGDILEVRTGAGRLVQVPFTREAVPVVDVRGRRVVVDPPAGLLDPEGPPPADADVGDDGPGGGR
jgi:16S rRNA processing protein RimM